MRVVGTQGGWLKCLLYLSLYMKKDIFIGLMMRHEITKNYSMVENILWEKYTHFIKQHIMAGMGVGRIRYEYIARWAARLIAHLIYKIVVG